MSPGQFCSQKSAGLDCSWASLEYRKATLPRERIQSVRRKRDIYLKMKLHISDGYSQGMHRKL